MRTKADIDSVSDSATIRAVFVHAPRARHPHFRNSAKLHSTAGPDARICGPNHDISSKARMSHPTDMRSAVKPYERPFVAASLFQFASAIGLFVGACALMYWSLQ